MATQADGLPRTHRTCRRPEQESTSSSSRNLVVCIDGTSNRFGTRNTNIVELYSHIKKSDEQLTYYSSGLGTVARVAGTSPRHQVSNALDMAFGWNLHKVIMASYRWLSHNYRDGDKVFLFGFSRGAYQVRALAGMIARVGLLLPGNDEQIPFAFELYSKTDDSDLSLPRPPSLASQPIPKESKKRAKYAELARTFQRTFCRTNVHIHFVGVWDTVSSVGLDRSKPLPCTTTSCDHICYFRHALALDERRVKFLPEYAYGGRAGNRKADDAHIKEVWFAGCHGDVGGGNRRNEKLQSGDIPLLWMRSQAVSAGLEMEPVDVMWKIDDLNKRITPSLDFKWWPLELFPLKHLLYYNSDRQTRRLHLGGPRRILPGQMVHVSVLFKNNYKPYAQFFNNPEMWPEPMFWNDAASHQRLHNLSDLWEKDIFDERSVQTLLDHLEQGIPNLDVLDRLAFMSSFDIGKSVITQDAAKILAPFLNNNDRVIRLCTAAMYCELGWELPLETHDKLVGQIAGDVSELLKSKDCRRACTYLPSLCKREDLKPGLINKANLKKLVEFCDNMRIDRHEEGTSTIVFHSAQALSMLMKLDAGLAQALIDIQAVTDITEALRLNCTPALVSVLSVVDGLAKYETARDAMKAGPTVATLLKLVKRQDDFVAPAAIRILCSFLPDDELRRKMLEFGVLSTLCEVLDRCSDMTRQVAGYTLIEFAKHEEVQIALSQDFLRKLAQRAQKRVPSKRDGAILALVTFGNTSVRTTVKTAICAEKTIPVLVARLRYKSTALLAASALARLSKIDDVAVMVSDVESVSRIVIMIQRRWFDGLRGEDGLQVLSELLECDQLRKAILKADAIGVLSNMIRSQQFESTHAGLHYLRIIGRFDQSGSTLSNGDALSLVPHVVNALCVPHRRVQGIAMEILRSFSVRGDLRDLMLQGLLDLLEDRRAIVILAVNAMLRSLAANKSVCNNVRTDERFRKMCDEYREGLVNLEYGEKGKTPRRREVYDSVGRTIQLMQMHDDSSETETQMDEGKRWLARVQYELES